VGRDCLSLEKCLSPLHIAHWDCCTCDLDYLRYIGARCPRDHDLYLTRNIHREATRSDPRPTFQEYWIRRCGSMCYDRSHGILLFNDNSLANDKRHSILDRRSHNWLAVLGCWWRNSSRPSPRWFLSLIHTESQISDDHCVLPGFTFVTSLCLISQNNHAAFILLGVLGCTAIGFVDNITFPGVTLVVEPQDIGLAGGVLGSIRACGRAIAQDLYTSVL